jgi:hypothetical protein
MQVTELCLSVTSLFLFLGGPGLEIVTGQGIFGDMRLLAPHSWLSLRIFGNILVVSMGCNEPHGTFNPPTNRYRHIALQCNRSTNHMDGYEVGLILAFARDHRGKVEAERIVFIQAHDRSWHYRTSIWDSIRQLTQTRYFWALDFGILPGHPVISTSCKKEQSSEMHCQTSGYRSWPGMHKVIEFLFANTSLATVSSRKVVFRSPCCATFFLSPSRLEMRKSEEYDQILTNLHWLTTHPGSSIWNGSRPVRPVQPHSDNKLVAELLERTWAFVFTGQDHPQVR